MILTYKMGMLSKILDILTDVLSKWGPFATRMLGSAKRKPR